MTLLRAKRVMEELVGSGRAFVTLPKVADRMALVAEFAACGIAAAAIETGPVDVRRLRERLGLTREQFAAHYGLEVETVRNWEIGKRAPDTTAVSYLQAISNDPETVERAYAPTPAD